LWTVRGLGARGLKRLCEAVGDPGELLEVPFDRWRRQLPLDLQRLFAQQRVDSLAHRADRLERQLKVLGYQVAFPGDAAWPTLLDELPDRPPLLFHLGPGAAAPPRRRVAMVGTRHPDTGFAPWAHRLAFEVGCQGVGVVSGAADGVDQQCHRGALDAKGETWAFLGCAIEQMDDGQRVLRPRFLAGQGTFFSEFPPGARSEKGTFPRRNRLISGSADAVVVLRAKLRSGTSHTADAAKRQGRPLLAVPGDPYNAVAEYPNSLLRAGTARPCLGPGDVLKAIGLHTAQTPGPAPNGPLLATSALSATARLTYQALGRLTLDIDAIVDLLPGTSTGAVVAALVELELSGFVVQQPGRRYERADRSRSIVDGEEAPN